MALSHYLSACPSCRGTRCRTGEYWKSILVRKAYQVYCRDCGYKGPEASTRYDAEFRFNVAALLEKTGGAI